MLASLVHLMQEKYPNLVTLAQQVSVADLNSAEFKRKLCDPSPDEHFFIVKGALDRAQQAGALRGLAPDLLPMTYSEEKVEGYSDPLEAKDGIRTNCEGVEGGQFVLYDLPQKASDLGGMGARVQHDRPKSGDNFSVIFSQKNDGKRVGAIDVEVTDPFDDTKTTFCTTVQHIYEELGKGHTINDSFYWCLLVRLHARLSFWRCFM